MKEVLNLGAQHNNHKSFVREDKDSLNNESIWLSLPKIALYCSFIHK